MTSWPRLRPFVRRTRFAWQSATSRSLLMMPVRDLKDG